MMGWFDLTAGLRMSKQSVSAPPAAPFEYELFEGDPDHLTTVAASIYQSSRPWIESSDLKLRHRIGRGPFGDVWLATHHQSTEDYDEYHEVAIKMLPLIKEELMKTVLYKFESLFMKFQGISTCLLHGISIIHGKVNHVFLLRRIFSEGFFFVCLLLYANYDLFLMCRQICIVMKFYEGSVGDKMAHLRAGKLSLPDVLR